MRTRVECGDCLHANDDWSPTHIAAILTVGRLGARMAGVQGEDTEDCAAAFIAHVWQKRGQIAAVQVPREKEKAFLRRCAYRFAISWARRERRNPVLVTDDMGMLDGAVTDVCEAAALRDELWRIVQEQLTDLAPHQQVSFLRCYVHEEERETVATEWGCTANAVKKVAQRARARLQVLLSQSGLSESLLREYLTKA
jgi:RNA polymerase sigma factor (sigma-70 family)